MKATAKRIFSVLFITLFVFSGCSGSKRSKKKKKSHESIADDYMFGDKDFAVGLLSVVKPKWFTTSERFGAKDLDGKTDAHLFFDTNPEISIKAKSVNFISVTEESSEYGYELDLVSGKHYLSRKYCDQDDAWKKYPDTINYPPFTIGIVPRLLDQLGLPQKIIVFGDPVYYKNLKKTNYFETRVVGGYVEQICDSGSCLTKDKWSSRLVLIGVQKGHPKYKKIKHVKEMSEVVDWEEVKAFINNGQGKNKTSDKFYPGYRMGATVGPDQAMNFLKKNSIMFSVAALKELQISCFKLYDHMWNVLAKRNFLEEKITSKEQAKKKLERIQEYRRNYDRLPRLFYKRFYDFYKKFGTKYKTCSKYVRAASVNSKIDRFWFFTFVDSYFKLQDLGWAYSCSRKVWISNPVISKGRRSYSINDQFRDCNPRRFDAAFEYSTQHLNTLLTNNKKSYRFVAYDGTSLGTHNKLYTWVPYDGKELNCANKENREFVKTLPFFPKDIKWERRSPGRSKYEKSFEDIIF